jgi:hypothetical protein
MPPPPLLPVLPAQVMTHSLDRSAHSLQEMTEYALPDNVLAVAWVGSNMVAGVYLMYRFQPHQPRWGCLGVFSTPKPFGLLHGMLMAPA